MQLKKLVLILIAFLPISLLAQTVSGTVKDDAGEVLPFANVIEKGTTNGTTSDLDGNFTLRVSILPTTLIINSLGYNEIVLPINTTDNINVTLKEEGVGLDEVVITGNRAKPRTILDSAVPIDNVSAKELMNSGKVTVEEMLTYKIPSYNSSNQTISDATAHFDPADLRGLGPSRTLVLINGKRKNQSALVYINDTPGKGEVGTDMKSIPAAAIDHIEVLRDGASAQYGSDAIAGVINIILKKDVKEVSMNIHSGITTKGDGFEIGADINGAIVGKNGGFINYTVGLQHQQHTNRAGEPGKDLLFGVPSTNSWIQQNPDLGMTVGQPDMNSGEIFLNGEVPINDNATFYSTLGVTLRKGKSFALYRAPYWVQDPHFLLHNANETYQGFQPTFETDITDFFYTGGANFDLGEFKTDASITYGSNGVDYTIGNTLNVGLQEMLEAQGNEASGPTQFEAGGYRFNNLIGNIDFSRTFNKVSLIFGAEYKLETFKAIEGEPASYLVNPVTGNGGAQSFPGLQPSNRIDENRGSFGTFVNADFDVNDAFLISGAVRFENYDDFGTNFSYKASARYKLGTTGAIRGSYSTGFRAPALHQIYLSNVQTLISGGTVSNQGTFNNVDTVIRDGLGVPQLKAETSTNFTGGITLKPARNLSLSLDYYNVAIDDRVLFTGEIGFKDDSYTDGSGTLVPDVTNDVEQILIDNNITSLKFFVNAVNTNTQGIDFVASYNNIRFPKGKLGFNLAFNWNETKVDGKINTPTALTTPTINGDSDYEIFNRKEVSRIETSRPSIKGSLGINYEQEKFSVNLNNTYFGEVTWKHSNNGLNGAPFGPNGSPLPTDDAAYDQTFAGKVITDVVFGYKISPTFKFNLIVNNALNVYPDEIDTKGDFVTDLGGRFKYPWEVNQFGFLGTKIKAGLNITF